jgi:hypothetical protein
MLLLDSMLFALIMPIARMLARFVPGRLDIDRLDN